MKLIRVNAEDVRALSAIVNPEDTGIDAFDEGMLKQLVLNVAHERIRKLGMSPGGRNWYHTIRPLQDGNLEVSFTWAGWDPKIEKSDWVEAECVDCGTQLSMIERYAAAAGWVALVSLVDGKRNVDYRCYNCQHQRDLEYDAKERERLEHIYPRHYSYGT